MEYTLENYNKQKAILNNPSAPESLKNSVVQWISKYFQANPVKRSASQIAYSEQAKIKVAQQNKSIQEFKNARTEMNKFSSITPKQAASINTKTPITGGFSFGGEATRKTYLPFAVVAVIGAYFFFNKSKKRRK
jgi:hypothetical protein